MAKETYGIAGYPVKHSLSPAMHNAAFKELGIDAEYRLFEVEPDRLEDFLDNIKRDGISGLNITIPHKINAKRYLERNGSVDETAERLGAVNTIKVLEGGLRGFNTDGPGFYRSFIKDLRSEPEGKSVFVLGAGGAAKSIVMYLGNAPARISVFDIDGDKAKSLEEQYGKYFDKKRLNIVTEQSSIKAALDDSDIMINATPLGMKESDPSPIDKKLLHQGMYVYDLVYNRPRTQLVKDANSMKIHAVTGLGMLLYQGAIAFEIWTGRKAPIGVMRRSLRMALGRS